MTIFRFKGMKDNHLIQLQKEICEKSSVKYTPTDLESIVGISDNTNSKNIPINGLRHPSKDNNSGWYIWSGEELSKNDDFFKPLHTKHLKKRCPEVLKFLGLPIGYRFITNGDYMDIWYDESLLKT